MKESNTYPVGRNNDVVSQESGKEVLIYDLLINKLFCLNETSSIVWKLCNGKNSVLQISHELSRQFKTPVSADFVWLAINQLKSENLIDNKIEFPTEFVKNSRREMIKKVGLATWLALPIISSITAPTTIQAVSVCRTNSASCSSSAQCCSTNTTYFADSGGAGAARFYTGACCRSNTGSYGARNTCVPGSSSGFTVPAGSINYNGQITSGETINCYA